MCVFARMESKKNIGRSKQRVNKNAYLHMPAKKLIGLPLLLTGVIMLFFLLLLWQLNVKSNLSGFWNSNTIEWIAIGINTVLLLYLLWLGKKRERKRLLHQFGSQNNLLAKDACKALSEKGWHINGRLKDIQLGDANLRQANLSKFQLSGSSLCFADLRNAILVDANLSNCDLRSVNFSEAECRRTNFSGANLRWANLEGAILDGANFEGADLQFATLGNHNPATVSLKGAIKYEGLNEVEVGLVQDSSKLIRKSMEAFSMAFYRELFRINPDVKKLFILNIKDQALKFGQVFELLVACLDKLELIIPKLKELGHRHIHYGIDNWHYEIAGEALLKTLEKSLGSNFDEEVKQAWKKVYQLVSMIMQDARP